MTTAVETHRQLIVTVALIERNGNLLIIRRYDPEHSQWHHRWEFPGGKIEAGETPLDAIRREIREETHLDCHSQRLLGVHTHNWDTSKGVQQTFILLYHCFSESDEVVLNPKENDAYAWEKPELILKRPDLLGGNGKMLQDLFL